MNQNLHLPENKHLNLDPYMMDGSSMGSTPVPLKNKYPIVASLMPKNDTKNDTAIVSGGAIFSEEHLHALEVKLSGSNINTSVIIMINVASNKGNVALKSKYPLVGGLTPTTDSESDSTIISGAAMLSQDHIHAIEVNLQANKVNSSIPKPSPVVNTLLKAKPLSSIQAPKTITQVNQPVSQASKLYRYDSPDHPANKGLPAFLTDKSILLSSKPVPAKPIITSQAIITPGKPVDSASRLPRYDSADHPANKGLPAFVVSQKKERVL